MRKMWTGTISFGLIHIPVNLYSAAASEGKLHFRYLRKEDLCPIQYLKVCRNTGEEVSQEEIVRGYEYQKGDYVILDDKDFQKAEKEKLKTIEIDEFVDEKEIENVFFEKPYFLEPTKEAKKAYSLLREALKKSGKVGIARFILRKKEHLAALQAMNDVIVLNQMRFVGELRSAKELNLPAKKEYSQKELDIALQLIKELTAPFKAAKYHDTYTETLKEIIQKKKKGKTVHIEAAKKPSITEAPNIMEALRKSLEEARQREAQSAKKKEKTKAK